MRAISPKTPTMKKPAPFTQLNQSLIERPISLDIFRPESPSYSVWMTSRNNQDVMQLIKALEERIQTQRQERIATQKAQLINFRKEIAKSKEECMQFCREYLIEASNTLINERNKKIKEVLNEQKQKVQQMLSVCSTTVEKFKNQQQKIMENLLNINKYEELREVQQKMTQLTQSLKQKIQNFQTQQKQQMEHQILKMTKNINKFKTRVQTTFKEHADETTNKIKQSKQEIQKTIQSIVQQYNTNFIEVQKNSKETMKIAKEMVEVAGQLSKKMGKIRQNETIETICHFMKKIDKRLYEDKENQPMKDA